jgi:CspA family cold shock protein
MQGTIKRVVRDRGFGFIKTSEGQEVFFHRSGLRALNFDSLHEGQAVEFEVRQGDKGPRAENVRGQAE